MHVKEEKHILTIIKSIALLGIEGYKIEVQVDVTNNMPKWEIVGLPDTSIKESKERVRAAIKNSGYELRSKKILINLAPAEIKKEGSVFDLAIAVGILNNIGYIRSKNLSEYTFLGELSLDGKVNPISGILPMCIELKKLGIKKVILSKASSQEASLVKDLEIYGVESLKEAIDFLNGRISIEKTKMEFQEELNNQAEEDIDYQEVKGQENVKRALEIAAAGGHNCILIGSPGSREDNASKKNNNHITRPEF